MKIHEKYINRCIQIAKNGLGTTRPNPMVGCVIVVDDTIIGEGFTSPYGGPHAEVNAINSVADASLLKQATLYVTIEPCSHHGKTPPCSDLIIKKGITKVVIGTTDTHSKVDGRGIDKLKQAGCQVTVGVNEIQNRQHHKRFFTFHEKQRPYIILKWAQSADGYIAPLPPQSPQRGEDYPAKAKPVWITNEYSRQLVHKWRAEEHAILVGTNTVVADNPSLTVRDWTGQNPIRVVLDLNNRLDKTYKVFDSEAETFVINSKTLPPSGRAGGGIAQQICDVLYKNNIQSIIIEGGRRTLQTFIDENLWDEARVFTGAKVFFEDGVKAPNFSGQLVSEEVFLNDVLKTYVND